jgi:hypothetical protein
MPDFEVLFKVHDRVDETGAKIQPDGQILSVRRPGLLIPALEREARADGFSDFRQVLWPDGGAIQRKPDTRPNAAVTLPVVKARWNEAGLFDWRKTLKPLGVRSSAACAG